MISARAASLPLLLLVLCAPVTAADKPPFRSFYVSPAGTDANPGTEAEPFRTLARARDAVRTVNREMNGDVVVTLRGGTYPVSEPLTFGPADSGFNGFRVVYRAFEHETPVLSGGVPVTGWALDHDNVYKAPLERTTKLRGLYVNGRRAEMTHADVKGQGPWGEFVVKGDEPWADTPGKTLDGVQFDAAALPALDNPSDVELLQHRVWNFLVMGVRDVARDGEHTVVKLQQPTGAIAATMAWKCNIDPAKAFTLRNAREFLKNPGEFYFDRTAHSLYTIPREGEDLTKAEVIAPTSEGLIRIAGTSTSDRVNNLEFTGLTFAYDHWLLEQVGDSRGMVGVQSLGLYTRFRADGNWHKSHYDICDLPQATVDARNAKGIRFERNRFTHLSSGVAVSLVNDVTDTDVVGNTFTDCSGNAVNVGHPTHYVIGGGPLFKEGVAGVCARDRIADNWVRRVSLDFKQEEAISGFFTEAVTIAHNDIRGVPYCGIALGWWWGNAEIPPSTVPKDNVIEANRVVDTQQELTGDGGAIYVLGQQPGGRIEGNYVRSPTRTLYADDGSAFWTIRRNVVDPRDLREPAEGAKRKDGRWLFLWVDRIHDLTVDDNYTTVAQLTNKAKNAEPTNTHVVEVPFPPEAQAIVDDAGLEAKYKDIAEGE